MDTVLEVLAPWQSLYSESTLIATLVVTVHVLALLVGGGFAIAADRMTLRMAARVPAERTPHLRELRDLHRPVLISLAAVFISGLLMLAADVEVYLGSWVFWVKMALVVGLLANGAILQRTEQGLRRTGPPNEEEETRLWRRLRTSSIASITLWVLTAIFGEILVAAA